MVFWCPTHSILTPLIHGILTHLPMVYWPPYPWYFDPSGYLLIRNEGGSSNTNPTKNRGELGCSGKVGCSCSTSGTRVNLVTNPVIGDEWRKDQCHMVFWSMVYSWYFWPPSQWYIEPPIHVILTPLPISWLEMRGSKYHGGSIFHTG
jgi:hypothetical protein